MIFSCLGACVNFDMVFNCLILFCFFRRTRKLNAELANGRLAMMAIIGMPLALQLGIPYVPYHYLVWEHAFILIHFVLAIDSWTVHAA